MALLIPKHGLFTRKVLRYNCLYYEVARIYFIEPLNDLQGSHRLTTASCVVHDCGPMKANDADCAQWDEVQLIINSKWYNQVEGTLQPQNRSAHFQR